MHFSVIVPARNEEANIIRCVASLVGCDWDPADFEVIVVDHCSSDRTAELAAAKGARVLKGRPEDTISGLRNFGAREGRGQILAFIDADCSVPANWLRQAAPYVDREDVVCFGSAPVVPNQATWVQQTWSLIRSKGKLAGDVDWLASMNMFVRRSEFLAIGGFDEKLITCEDYDLSLRLRRVGKMIADPRVVAVHHGEAATVRHFFRKEYWHGTSNIAGILAHGFSLQELPSVALPVVYAALFVVVPLLMVSGVAGMNNLLLVTALSLVLAWQAPILLLAAWKNRSTLRPVRTLQLYLLLNVYFLARGGSILRFRRS